MALKTAQEYIDSLRTLKSDVWLFGEKIDNFVDFPVTQGPKTAASFTNALSESHPWSWPRTMLQSPTATQT